MIKEKKTDFTAFPSLCHFKTPIWWLKRCLTRTPTYFFIYYTSMNVSINILFVAHPRHNMPQLLSRKVFRHFFHLPLRGHVHCLWGRSLVVQYGSHDNNTVTGKGQSGTTFRVFVDVNKKWRTPIPWRLPQSLYKGKLKGCKRDDAERQR